MSQSGHAREPAGDAPRFRRPAALFFEPSAPEREEEHFFGLESLTDPGELLSRATELAVSFQDAADRSVEYQAIAAARLADPARLERLPADAIADRAGWTEDYAQKMIEFGQRLLSRPPAE